MHTPAQPPLVTPAASDEPLLDFPACINEAAARHPHKPAVRFEGHTVTWQAFNAQADQAAAALVNAGIKPYDKVAIIAHACPEYLALFVGTLRAGACAVPLSSMATAETLAGMIQDSDARVLLASAEGRAALGDNLLQLSRIPPQQRLALDFEAPGWVRYQDWLASAPATAPRIPMQPDYHFNLIYSSGTTGVPKGILHDHCMRSRQIQRMSKYGLNTDAVTIASTPLYSNTTLVAVLPTLACGGTVVLMRKFDVQEFLQRSQDEHVTHAMLVPVQYQRILAHADFDKYDLSHYQLKLSTSAPLHADTMRAILKRWPGKLIEIYGLTEGGISTILNASKFPDKLDSVGQPPEGVELCILDENGKVCTPGVIGEIAGYAGTMMVGYYKRPDLTSQMIWTSPEGKTFFKTGDLGKLDADGFLYLLDRKKDMIISGGFNVYAADLEAVLLQHPQVGDAAVIAIPSQQWGETPLGLVVLKRGASTDATSIRDWANTRLGKNQRLSNVELRDSLPRSSIGKVLKRELRAPYWAEEKKQSA